MNRKKTLGPLFLLALVPAVVFGQSSSPRAVGAQVRAYTTQHEADIVKELAGLASIPNSASDEANIRRNADRIVSLLQQRGVVAKLLEVPGAPPYIYGDLPAPGATRTIAFYAHYDGQPVDASQWASNPWVAVLRDKSLEQGGKEIALQGLRPPVSGEDRLYARSVSDDKAPIVAMLAALDALQTSGIPRSVNVKFFFEGEEERGSPHLEKVFEKYTQLLTADAWFLCDGPAHQSGRKLLYFGARGVFDLELTVYGPVRSLHSGHYGNWAPNPAALLAGLLSSMRDRDGRIRIAGFYDDVRPLTKEEENALNAVPRVEPQLRNDLGIAWTEGGGQSLAKLITLPALNIRGIEAGHVGAQTQNAIPTEATASIDFRLVPDQTPEKVHASVEEHVAKQGFFVVHDVPDMEARRQHGPIARLAWGAGYPAGRTSMDLPFSRAAASIISSEFETPVVELPTVGGSVPMYLFLNDLHAPVIGLAIVNYDNNQHAANENLKIQNLWDGVEIFAGLIARMGQTWH